MIIAIVISFAGACAHAAPAAVRPAPTSAPPAAGVMAREQTAATFAAQNQPAKVIELLNPYTDQLSDGGFLNLASSYSNLKDYVNEVRVFKIISGRADENFQWHMLLGQAYLKQASITLDTEKYQETVTNGVAELRRALQLNKKFKPAFDALLVTLLQQKNNNEARELLVEGIVKFGDRPELYRELCRLDALDGFLVQAVEHCRISINLSPNFPDHYVYLTQALQDQRETQAAEKEIVMAGRKFPNNEFVQWAAGTMYFARKNFPVAARYFEAAVKAAPNEGRSRYGLAQALFSSGEELRALEHFKVACKARAGGHGDVPGFGQSVEAKRQGRARRAVHVRRQRLRDEARTR